MCLMAFIHPPYLSSVLNVLCNVVTLYKMAASPKIDLAFSALNGTLSLGRG